MNYTSDNRKVDFKKSAFKSEKEAANEKYAKDWKLELLALSGFCLSGVLFIVSGVQNGDFLTVSGSVVWIVSCLCWMIPYRRFF
ncbi:MAG: hypothetical protein CVU60_12225 [Deltaproteobacteria bacterium HGW-Deltaproteobacteria-18]|nr:MAG: hypothetical protein CVU60_12225 [Deltaproteobacteria bacterium HGW-Deltaproteobacteria-18]